MTTIPLNQLIAANSNVRKTGARDGIEELAASIAAHGLLTSLAVRKAARGKFTVIAGQRRFHALSLLAERDVIPANEPVLCQIVDRKADPIELGLAENVVRAPMHPADQFEAFAALIDKGSSAAEVAARFGVSEGVVAARMQLGRVSPALLDAYRAGDMKLDQVQAFAVSDDHAAQERVWSGLRNHYCSPSAVREALTEGEIPATDKRVRCVGLDAYEAAGGAVRRDLFDDRNAGYVLDTPLLDQLVQQALIARLSEVQAEGWSWAEIRPEFGYPDMTEFERCNPEEVELSKKDAAERDTLEAERDGLEDEQYDEDGQEIEAVSERIAQIDTRLDVLREQSFCWTPERKASAGAVIHLAHDGSIEVERGLVRMSDRPEEAVESEDDKDVAVPVAALPAILIASMTAAKTAGLRASLARHPAVALAAVTHALARRAFYSYGGETCLDITLRHRALAPSLKQPSECDGLTAYDSEHTRWQAILPEDADELWGWCLEQSQEVLLQLLAVSAAHALDAVRDKGVSPDAPSLQHADALAKALSFDMHDWFTPTAENYFSRVNRTLIMEAMMEAGAPARTRSWSKLKKAELAALAERTINGTGWLPLPLRTNTGTAVPYVAQTDMPAAAAA